MKTLAILFLTVALASAQTNTITFKNKSGDTITGKVTRVDADGVIYQVNGGGGKVMFTDLPEEVRQTFGYDPAAAAKVIAAKSLAQRRYAQAAAQVAQQQFSAAEHQKRANQFFEGRIHVEGVVFQKFESQITVEDQLGKPGQGGPLLFMDVRDIDPSSYDQGQPVRFYAYDLKQTVITNTSGFIRQRPSVTLKIPAEFKNDPRTKEIPKPRY